MFKSGGWILMAALVAGGAWLATGQMPVPDDQKRLSNSWEAIVMRLTREASPELYAYQQRLKAIEAEIAGIVGRFSKNKISRAEAKEQLLPLVREKQRVQNSPDFMAEQVLIQSYYSSTKFQTKVKKLLEGVDK